MKLIIAIVQDEDTDALTQALIAAGHRFTKVSTTGSFLRTGNTSLLIGVEDRVVGPVLAILRRTCRRRTQIAVPYSPALEPGLLYMPENFEVEVGGAVVFVANVSRFERL
ncbi:MAG: protein from nitrogen regulatory protein P-II (GLNB) family, ortholog YAAQ B. subtilis [uncultured Thermomicrobiales bacterium]|uniref:Protein from nitrogen regulatory protein P-II (GLNB) family, ortholog YAAQ B. subtilis n=1 Tax=uncultured Thermomicrobiales bacterium TaxID=1645740 RepID=A0A6J4VGI9_9BACT|nr:MAG: protein from nitrogen regulatory protein P-II (GLNB) family, ortholog YAAQ B. subtilis [uncultured Thermomicrobiales bacterium]